MASSGAGQATLKACWWPVSVCGWCGGRDHLFGLMHQPSPAAWTTLPAWPLSAPLIVASLALIAAIDVPLPAVGIPHRLRMTKEEVRQEMKEQEGDPRSRPASACRPAEMSRRRMMSNVPTADVVVTNPTHYAVALKHDPEKAGAPMVVARAGTPSR